MRQQTLGSMSSDQLIPIGRRLDAFVDDVAVLSKVAIMDDLPSIDASGEELIPITDVSGYATMTIEVSGTFVANISAYEGVTGNDMQLANLIFGSNEDLTTVISGPGLFTLKLRSPLVSLKATSYTSGTPKVTAYLTSTPFTPRTVSTVSTSLNVLNSSTVLTGANTFTTSAVDVRSKRQLFIGVSISSMSGTSPQLTASVEASIDGSAPWFPLLRSDSTPIARTVTAAGDFYLSVNEPFGRYVRLKYLQSGTSPVSTLTTRMIGKD